jgi:UDP-glucose 4-epimerase
MVHIDDVARLMVALIGSQQAVGQIYNVAGAEFASILGTVHIMARAVGVSANIVHVPLDVLQRHGQSVIHWGEGIAGGTVYSIQKALADLDWKPRFGLEDAYRDSYAWFRGGGRDHYQFDFSADDALLTKLDETRPGDRVVR